MLRLPLRTSPEMGVGRWGVAIHATPFVAAGTVPKTKIALYQAFWYGERLETDTSLPAAETCCRVGSTTQRVHPGREPACGCF